MQRPIRTVQNDLDESKDVVPLVVASEFSLIIPI